MVAPSTAHRPSSQVTPRTILTICFSVLAIIAGVYFLARTEVAVTLTLAAAMAAVALDHVVSALTRRGLRRPWAVALVVLALLALGVGMGFLLVPVLLAQGKALVLEAPALWQRLEKSRAFLALNAHLPVGEALRQSVTAATGAVAPVLNAITSVLRVGLGLLTLLFLSVFMLIFGGDLVNALLAQAAPQYRERYRRVANQIYRSVGGYLGGLLGICSINAVLTTVFLAIIRMPFFLPLGILSGCSSLVPYAGSLVANGAITLLVLATGGMWKALATLIYFILYGQLEGNVLGPVVYRRTVHVNPLVTFLAILFLAEFMGVPGAIVAVPVAAAAQIVLWELLSLRREREAELISGASAPAETGPR
jgi:predicted PurR-regulated permease PerM